MRSRGAILGIEGALAAFPRRLAGREVARQGGVLRRGITRRTTHVVFGRTLLERHAAAEIEARFDAASADGRIVLSEAGFLRKLGLLTAPEHAAITAESLLGQSKLTPRELALLALFDAFEHDTPPFSFSDLILAKKYAGLLAGGAGWHAIARSVHRSGTIPSLTRLSLHADGAAAIYARHGDGLAELNGQQLLPLDEPDEAAIEDYFEAAAAAEAEGRFADAAAFYGRCLAFDPGDSVSAYNRANCLRELGELDEAAFVYAQALKLDPGLVEAWFNFAGLLRTRGQAAAAHTHLQRAVTLDPSYADAVYNLATLHFDAGELSEARRWWSRYLELDPHSKWATLAARGIQYADLQLRKTAG